MLLHLVNTALFAFLLSKFNSKNLITIKLLCWGFYKKVRGYSNEQPGNRNAKCTVKTAAAEFRALCKRVRLLFRTEAEEPQYFDAFSRMVTGLFIIKQHAPKILLPLNIFLLLFLRLMWYNIYK